MSIETPSVEVLIVGYNSANVIEAAIESVALIPGATVAVVDHGESPDTLAKAQQTANRMGISLRGYHDPTNPGFAGGCNGLAANSSAEWLLFLNPDAVITQWSTSVLMDGRVIGALQKDQTGKPIHSYGLQYRVADEVRRSWLRRTPPLPTGGIGYVGGAALAVQRHWFHQLNGFDSAYFLFYEDIDFCLRATKQSMKVEVSQQWHVTHSVGHSARKNWVNVLAVSFQSGQRFHRTHYGEQRKYSGYVAVDSLLRIVSSKDGSKRRGYVQLLKQAIRATFSINAVASGPH